MSCASHLRPLHGGPQAEEAQVPGLNVDSVSYGCEKTAVSRIALSELIGMGQAERDTRLAFLGLDEARRAHLRSLSGFVEEIADELVERFYQHLHAFDETRALLQDPQLVIRVKAAQRSHLIRLTSAEFDSDYFDSRLHVGMTHARIGLEPKWYIGAYMTQLAVLYAELFKRFDDPQRIAKSIDALTAVVMLDIELAIDAYIYGGFVEKSLADAHRSAAEQATAALAARDEQEARKEELLRMVIHDIRSPVTAMMSTARVGLRRASDIQVPPGKQFRLIEDTGAHVLEIIDNMLTIARVTRGEMPVKVESFDLARQIAECVRELTEYAGQAQHSLFYCGVESAQVEGLDSGLVRRIVSNLITNAIRHTPAGTRIDVCCDFEAGRCAVTVADDGPGIPREVVERINAVSGDTGPRSEGAYLDSGLGLPFCRLAAERLAGRLLFEASGPAGSRIVVDLPAARATD
jgi:signal transduction histidine kinase